MDEWQRLWGLYFFALSDATAKEWLAELDARKCTPREGELVHVVRWMEKRRKSSDRRPTLGDLKDAIWARRDEAKEYARKQDGAPGGAVDCGLCGGSGLLCFNAELTAAGLVRMSTIRLGTVGHCGLVSCPCECDRGRRMYQCDDRITDAVVALYRHWVRVPEPKRREVERADLW